MLKVNDIEIKATIFPDKTSQVWHLPKEALTPTEHGFTIQWFFESEAELMHLAQLRFLLDSFDKPIDLWIRTLPYARQDKAVSNDSTFALIPFTLLLNSLAFDNVFIVDPHNHELTDKLTDGAVILSPENNISYAEAEVHADTFVFPDKGAASRYELYPNNPPITFEKVRNQATGKIIKYDVAEGIVENKVYLIVDDLCDAGATFIECAKKLYELGAKEVHLYVSHGLFTQGTKRLFDAGIKRIFTYDGEVHCGPKED